MTSQYNREELIKKNDNKIKQLAIQLESHSKDEDNFFHQLGSSIDKLAAFSANKENFSEEGWEEIEARRKALNEKIDTEVGNVRDPRKTKRAYSSLKRVERHWLHVK